MSILRDCIYGAAIGDAFGVPYEFMGRESFQVGSKMAAGGVHNQPVGTFSDDTSMLLATCASIKENNGKINTDDMLAKFRSWAKHGEYAIDHNVFDIGITVSKALNAGQGLYGERDNGNGSLMRILPLSFIDCSDAEIEAVSGITHAHRISKQACVFLVRLAQTMLSGDLDLKENIERLCPADYEFSRLNGVWKLDEDEISSSGYVIHTLEAALWSLTTTGNYKDCVTKAVNLGGDTDTIGCIAGGLAGILYGMDSIPKKWTEQLRGKDIIEPCLF